VKKVLGTLALIVVVLILVWGYRTAKTALMAPVPMVEALVGPYDIVFGPAVPAGGGKEDRAALTKALTGAGIKTGESVAMWITAGAGNRTGAMIGRADLAKARKLPGPFRVVHLPAQKGWVASGVGAATGAVAVGLAMGRTAMSLMGKAQALGWKSYIFVSRFAGETSESAVVPAPR